MITLSLKFWRGADCIILFLPLAPSFFTLQKITRHKCDHVLVLSITPYNHTSGSPTDLSSLHLHCCADLLTFPSLLGLFTERSTSLSQYPQIWKWTFVQGGRIRPFFLVLMCLITKLNIHITYSERFIEWALQKQKQRQEGRSGWQWVLKFILLWTTSVKEDFSWRLRSLSQTHSHSLSLTLTHTQLSVVLHSSVQVQGQELPECFRLVTCKTSWYLWGDTATN